MQPFYRLNETTWIDLEEISSIHIEEGVKEFNILIVMKNGDMLKAEKTADSKQKMEKEVLRILNLIRRVSATTV